MRKFKFVLILAVVSFLTVGIYTLFIRSIDESDFVVETVKGDPKQSVVRSVHADIIDQGLKNLDYNVRLDGHVQKTAGNLITSLFNNPIDEEGEPTDFRRFIASDKVTTLEQEGITYGIGIKDKNKWELQYWNASKQRVVKKIFPEPSEAQKLGEIDLIPYQRVENSLYVYAQDYATNLETLLYKINLKNDTVQKINLPYTSKKYTYILGIHDETIVYYTSEGVEGSDATKETVYLSNGKTVQPLKGLDLSDAFQTKLSIDGTKLIMFKDELKGLRWTVYDLTSKKMKKYSMILPHTKDGDVLNKFIEPKNDMIYMGSQAGDGVINIRVVDALSKRVIYEGNIKDKLKRKETMFNTLILN
ncbi:hypothetical protein ACWS7L_05505 [Exiguobacterium artemiae]